MCYIRYVVRIIATAMTVLILVAGCGKSEPIVTIASATATRIALEPTHTFLPPTATPAPPTPTDTPNPPTETATPSPTATSTPTATATPTATPLVRPGSSHSCQERAVFGDRADSPYVLPYPVGSSYMVSQSICNSPGSHRNQLAYDFEMPIGANVTAARGGIVMLAQDNTPDVGTEQYKGQANCIFIQHEDGTVAFYAHLKQDSVVVKVGERVEIGQRIAASGNSGYTGGIPHLHFGVYAWWPPEEGYDVPVNFRNATAFGALMPGGRYQALDYEKGASP